MFLLKIYCLQFSFVSKNNKFVTKNMHVPRLISRTKLFATKCKLLPVTNLMSRTSQSLLCVGKPEQCFLTYGAKHA